MTPRAQGSLMHVRWVAGFNPMDKLPCQVVVPILFLAVVIDQCKKQIYCAAVGSSLRKNYI